MIFYVATNEEGQRTLCKTQAEAKAIDKDFQQLDIPTDKDGLRDAIQELLSLIDAQPAPVEPESQESTPEAPEPFLRGTDVTGMSHEERNSIIFPVTDHLRFREMVEEEWDNQPLGWRLDLANLTLEECRKAIPWVRPSKETQTDDQTHS